MGLPQLYMQPHDPSSWRAWSFNHAANHYDLVTAGLAYQQSQVTLATTAATLPGNNTLEFGAVNGVRDGMAVADLTTPATIAAGARVTGFTGTLVAMSVNASATIAIGDNILFGSGVASLPLEQFILDPMDPDDLGMWLYLHATTHDQLNQVLGTSGFGLVDLDWHDPDQFAEWLRLNGDEHTRFCTALGVG